MRYQIKIKTLTQIHVGSGEKLKKGFDFLVKNGKIVVIDYNKLGRIVGTDKNTIAHWSADAMNGKINNFIRSHTKGARSEDYAKRQLDYYGNEPSEIQEHIRNARGLPYVPGSSIKGSIRTAVFADIAAERAMGMKKSEVEKLEKETLGDTYNSLFRFIQVGDAYFCPESAVVTELTLLKKNGCGGAPIFAEVLLPDESSVFELTLDTMRYERAEQSEGLGLPGLPNGMLDAKELFKRINSHTESLINSEIEKWEESENDDVTKYVECLKEILDLVEECKENPGTCVLRLGRGSGWRFITGAWTEGLPGDVKKEMKLDKGPEFPKSRVLDAAIDEDINNLLGFVKLSITN